MIAHFCDRCGAELWRQSTAKIQRWGQVFDEDGRGIAELCESCTVQLSHWLEEMSEVREGRRSLV